MRIRPRAAVWPATIAGTLVAIAATVAHAEARLPNVLLIVAEDLSPRIGSFGDPVAITPHIDALATQGVRYPNTFTAAGVCAPSRAALITGMHPISIGASHMRTASRPEGRYLTVLPPEVRPLPDILRAHLVHTINFAKHDYQFAMPIGAGPPTMWDEDLSMGDVSQRSSNQPFFEMVNLAVTHESGVFTPLGSWPNSFIHLAMQLARFYQFGGSITTAGSVSPNDVVLPPYYPDVPAVREDLATYYDNIAYMDQQVGELLAKLEADGLAESTIVVWTTDHGDGLPRAKRELYDSGLRVPMIVRWPEALRPTGAGPGSVDERRVSFVDLAPQILEWMGVAAPANFHGQAFAGPDAPKRSAIFAQRDRIDAVRDRQRAMRDARFKYIRSWAPELPGGHALAFRDNQRGVRAMRALYEEGKLDPVQRLWFEPVKEERLYDLESDPFEVRDVSGDPRYAADLSRMRGALETWLTRVGDLMDAPEDEIAERFWPGGDQPETANPTFSERRGSVTIRSATPGAAIDYRSGDQQFWTLYTEPFAAKPGQGIEARAVRYGYAESNITHFKIR